MKEQEKNRGLENVLNQVLRLYQSIFSAMFLPPTDSCLHHHHTGSKPCIPVDEEERERDRTNDDLCHTDIRACIKLVLILI